MKEKKDNKKTKEKKESKKKAFIDDFLDDFLSDPHVRIVGRKEDVLRVKDKVMAVLDAKVSQRIFCSFSHPMTRATRL
jgi:hypothetical protein